MFKIAEHSKCSPYGEHDATLTFVASRQSRQLTHPSRSALTFTAVTAALSDPVRLAIVATLGALDAGSELPCTTFELPVSKSTQSAHFRTLREAGIIRQRDEGTRRLNSLRRDDLDERFPGLLDLAITQGQTHVKRARARSVRLPAGSARGGGQTNNDPSLPSPLGGERTQRGAICK
jgi:DNA-binding transcriptional ArsR family regulator